MWRGGVENSASFHSHGIKYFICKNCGHVNGEFMETSEFTSAIYEDSAIDYGKLYKQEDGYKDRMHKIYSPKVKFMMDVLAKNGEVPDKLSYIDVGAGSGYFVGAMLEEGLNAGGADVSESQINFGNAMLHEEKLVHISQDGMANYIRNVDADVVSFIGVLEHVVNLNEILDAVAMNNKLKYMYFLVPMFCYSVIWESVFEHVYNRLLGGSHTHVFTDQSIAYINKKYHWTPLGEWRFGADAADMMRSLIVYMNESGNEYLAEMFHSRYLKIIDDMQMVMDKDHFCSEIHMIVKL